MPPFGEEPSIHSTPLRWAVLRIVRAEATAVSRCMGQDGGFIFNNIHNIFSSFDRFHEYVPDGIHPSGSGCENVSFPVIKAAILGK